MMPRESAASHGRARDGGIVGRGGQLASTTFLVDECHAGWRKPLISPVLRVPR